MKNFKKILAVVLICLHFYAGVSFAISAKTPENVQHTLQPSYRTKPIGDPSLSKEFRNDSGLAYFRCIADKLLISKNVTEDDFRKAVARALECEIDLSQFDLEGLSYDSRTRSFSLPCIGEDKTYHFLGSDISPSAVYEEEVKWVEIAGKKSCFKVHSTTDGFIRQGQKSWKEFRFEIQAIKSKKENDLFARCLAKLKVALNKVISVSEKEHFLVTEKLDSLRKQLRALEKCGIYKFDSKAKSPNDFLFAWNNASANELFYAGDVINKFEAKGGEAGNPLLEQYLVHPILAHVIGHYSAILLSQEVWRENYPSVESIIHQDVRAPYGGKLQEELREIINWKVTWVELAEVEDVDDVCDIHNESWKATPELQIAEDQMRELIENGMVYVFKVKGAERKSGIYGVLFAPEIYTGGKVKGIQDGKELWGKLIKGKFDSIQKEDTRLFIAIGTGGRLGRDSSTSKIKLGGLFAKKASELFSKMKYRRLTYSPVKNPIKKFNPHAISLKEFKEGAKDKGISKDEIQKYALPLYLVSVLEEGPKEYIDHCRKNGFVAPGNFFRTQKRKAHCPVENYHMGNGAEIAGVLFENGRADAPNATVLYNYEGFENENDLFKDLIENADLLESKGWFELKFRKIVSPAPEVLEARSKSDKIHRKNIAATPRIGGKEVWCHIISDLIIPERQRDEIGKLERKMRQDPKCHEKIVRLIVHDGENFMDKLKMTIARLKGYYQHEGFTTVRFDVAVDSVDKIPSVNAINGKVEMKALAFSPADKKEAFVQVEGIMFALRTLHTGNLARLKEAFRLVTEKGLTSDQMSIDSIKEFIKEVVFALPAVKVEDYQLRKELNDNMRKSIRSAA